jgi:hypothetical protein
VSSPQGLGGLTDQISTPQYAAASGLLLWGAHHWGAEDVRGRAREGVGSRIGRLFRGLVP